MNQESLNQNCASLTLAERCAAIEQEFYIGYYVFLPESFRQIKMPIGQKRYNCLEKSR